MLNWFKRRSKKPKSYRSNEEWLQALSGSPDEAAVEQLRAVLVRGLKPALAKYVDRELNHFVEDITQDSLLKILDNIDSFRGDSKFTTWCMKIAVREGLSEFRRKRYSDISIQELTPDDSNPEESMQMSEADPRSSPEQSTHVTQVMDMIKKFIDEELTDKQKTAINALMMQGLPITVVAEQMDTNRNALYKLVHDARLKLKKRLMKEGIDPEQMLNEL